MYQQYSLDSVSVRSRCLDLMPSSVTLKSELYFQAYGVSTIASTVADP